MEREIDEVKYEYEQKIKVISNVFLLCTDLPWLGPWFYQVLTEILCLLKKQKSNTFTHIHKSKAETPNGFLLKKIG